MSKNTLKGFYIDIEGHVQGVGFRCWTASIARSLSIKGWVRNMDDGNVNIYAVSDDEKALHIFIDRLQYGHPIASVGTVHITEESKPSPQFSFFSIH